MTVWSKMGLMVNLWIWLLLKGSSVWEPMWCQRVLESGIWTWPWRPATSLPDGEAEVQSGAELIAGGPECVPEAAPNCWPNAACLLLIVFCKWNQILLSKAMQRALRHSEEKGQHTQAERDYQKGRACNPSFIFLALLLWGQLCNDSEPQFLHLRIRKLVTISQGCIEYVLDTQ